MKKKFQTFIDVNRIQLHSEFYKLGSLHRVPVYLSGQMESQAT